MKLVRVEKISNLRTISSSNIPYFLKKGKSSWSKIRKIDSALIDQN